MEFDEKFNEAMIKIDNILKNDYNPKNLKKFLDGFKLEKSIEDRRNKKIEESILNGNKFYFEEPRKKIVNLYEIKEHNEKVYKFKANRIINNELKQIQMKQLENEYLNKIEKQYKKNIKTGGSYDKKNFEEKYNNIKVKEFSRLVNKINQDKISKEKNKKNKNFVSDISQISNIVNNSPERDFNTIDMSLFNNNNINKNRSSSQKLSKRTNNNKNILNTRNIIPHIPPSKSIESKINEYNNNIKAKNNIKNKLLNQNGKYNKMRLYSSGSNAVNMSTIKKSNKLQKIPKNSFQKQENKYNIDIRKPLDIKPDYLHQKDLKLFQKPTKKIYEINKNNKFMNKEKFLNNIHNLKYQADKFEEQAKKQEQLIKINHGSKYNINQYEKVSNLLVDSISTKLALLNQLNFTDE